MVEGANVEIDAERDPNSDIKEKEILTDLNSIQQEMLPAYKEHPLGQSRALQCCRESQSLRQVASGLPTEM